jgi:hypothetical protein
VKADGMIRFKARTETATLPDNDDEAPPTLVTAKCKRGERFAFGGFAYQAGEDVDPYLSDLRRAGKRRWVVGAFNFEGSPELTAIAYCSKHAPKTSTKSKTVTVPGDGEEVLRAKCGRNKRLRFGGYSADVTYNDAFVMLHGLARTSSRTWQVSARNDNLTSPGELTAYAYCEKK